MSVEHVGGRVPPLPGELSDLIAEALFQAGSPRRRAEVIRALVVEISETERWLIKDEKSSELRSLQRVVGEADAHCRRMDSETRREATAACANAPTGYVRHTCAPGTSL